MDRVAELPEHRLRKPLKCPWCKKEHDMALGMTGVDKPSAGDVFVCTNCHHINVVLGASELRRATYMEVLEFLKEMPELGLALTALKQIRGNRRSTP